MTEKVFKPGSFVRYLGKNEIPVPLVTGQQTNMTVHLGIKRGAIGQIMDQEPRKVGNNVAFPVEFSIALRSDLFVLYGCLFIQEDQLSDPEQVWDPNPV